MGGKSLKDNGWLLYKGDCLTMLDKLYRRYGFAAVVTDPPYGIKFHSGEQIFKGKERIVGDSDLELSKAIYHWCKKNQLPLVMFYSPFEQRPGKFRSVLVWSKGEHTGIGGDRQTCWKRDFELIGVAFNGPLSGKRDSAVLKVPGRHPVRGKYGKGHGHLAEKPLSLMKYLIRKVVPTGGVVFDPCCGSGSTGVAAVEIGYKFVGIELEEKWYNVAKARLESSFKRNTLFY